MDRNANKRRIKTQQGFSQHVLELGEEDARIYTDLLTRNKIWWADVTPERKSGVIRSPESQEGMSSD